MSQGSMLAPPRFFVLASLLAFSASALADGHATEDPRDPWEGYNRAIYGFNKKIDSVLLKPVAQAYDTLVPRPVDQGVTNFFANIGDIRNSLNNFLQGKPGEGASSFARLLVNSTVGLLGFIDIATKIGIEKSTEDFGQTLGSGGVGPGPYFVLPFFGPSTVRDTVAMPVDIAANLFTWADDTTVRNVTFGVRTINQRADLLDTEEAVEGITEDEYALVRNAFLEQRAYEVSDGAMDDLYDFEE